MTYEAAYEEFGDDEIDKTSCDSKAPVENEQSLSDTFLSFGARG